MLNIADGRFYFVGSCSWSNKYRN